MDKNMEGKIMWEADPRWEREPRPITVISETKCFVTVLEPKYFRPDEFSERRKRKEKIFETWEEAKQALVDNAILMVRSAQSSLDSAKDRLKKINDFKKP